MMTIDAATPNSNYRVSTIYYVLCITYFWMLKRHHLCHYITKMHLQKTFINNSAVILLVKRINTLSN